MAGGRARFPRSVGRRHDCAYDTGCADALVLYCKAFSKATEVASATMTGIDRYGFEMSAKAKEAPRPVRLAFGKPVSTPAEARAALIAMLQDAKGQLG